MTLCYVTRREELERMIMMTTMKKTLETRGNFTLTWVGARVFEAAHLANVAWALARVHSLLTRTRILHPRTSAKKLSIHLKKIYEKEIESHFGKSKSRKKALLLSPQEIKIRNLIDMYKNMWGELSKHQRKSTLENFERQIHIYHCR